MSNTKVEVRRRRDGQATHRRVLDAVVRTILEVGYYKASSNEIARRAGVTWGAIQHLFGSREELMRAVVEDAWGQLENQIATARIDGTSLEERLRDVLEVLATYYEQPAYLVQLQILLDVAANPDVSAKTRRAARHRKGQELTNAWQPLFAQTLGEAAGDEDLVAYVFATLRSYLAYRVIAGHITGFSDDAVLRDLLVKGVAAAVREEATRRGMNVEQRSPVGGRTGA